VDKKTIESSRRYARIAGLSYIVTIFLGIFSVNYIESNLIIPGDDAATLHNIVSNEFLFRVGVASEILMYLLVILLAFSLYVVLKSIDKNLAFLALLWRMGEAVIGSATIVLSGLIPILLIKSGSVFEPEKLQILVKLFLDLRSSGLDIVLIFIGMGGTIFCYLFYKSGYIPKILAVWGILTYLIMLILSFSSILTPISDTIKLAFYTPGGLFELLLGFWLLIKSIKVGPNGS
jgi:hypothetical protein